MAESLREGLSTRGLTRMFITLRDSAYTRIAAVWILLVLIAATMILLLSASRNDRFDAAISDANALASQAATITGQAVRDQFAIARTTAEALLSDEVDRRAMEQAVTLSNAEAVGIIDVDNSVVLGIAIPGTVMPTDVDLPTILAYFPDAEAALTGLEVVGYMPDIDGESTLVGLFVPYVANDGTRRVFANGVRLDRSVYATLLETSTPGFTLFIRDSEENLLFTPSEDKVARHHFAAEAQAPIVGRSAISGTPWTVVAHATHQSLMTGLDNPLNTTAATVAMAVLAVLLLGWLATRALLSHAKVEEAYAQVAWAARQQNEFTAVVAHELRTPATSASGLAAFLNDRWGDLTEEQRHQMAGRVAASTQDLARLVSDLRLAQGLTSGPVSLTPTARNISEVLSDALAMSGVDMADVSVGGDLDAMAIVDHRFASRALSSVIGNARTHGSAPIDLTVETAGTDVVVRIRDHGEGVPESFVPHLFEPFTQARSHLRRTHRGTGLGLHLVRAIVEQMGGRVDHQHAEPGAEFVVRLPAGNKVSPVANRTEARAATER